MTKSWWKGHHRGSGDWKKLRAEKPPRPPLEGVATEFVSVVLKEVEHAEDDPINRKIVVPGTMPFAAFTVRAREALNLGADSPLQLFVGPRMETPADGSLMSSFPKLDFLYVSYRLSV